MGSGVTIIPPLGLGLGEGGGSCATRTAAIDGLLLGMLVGMPLGPGLGGGICATRADIEGLLLGVPLGMLLGPGIGGGCCAKPAWGATPNAAIAATATRPMLPMVVGFFMMLHCILTSTTAETRTHAGCDALARVPGVRALCGDAFQLHQLFFAQNDVECGEILAQMRGRRRSRNRYDVGRVLQ